MDSPQRTLNERILHAEPGLPITFDHLRASYNEHRDAEALDELFMTRIELRKRAGDMHYVLAHIAAGPQHQAIGYIAIAVSNVSSSYASPTIKSLLHPFSRNTTPSTPSAQVIDSDALLLPHDDACLRRHSFPAPCPLACLIAAGLSVGIHVPSPGHGKQRSSWFAALMFWLLAGETKADETSAANGDDVSVAVSHAAVDQRRCTLTHDFARRTGAAGWKAQVEQLEKDAGREGRRIDKEKEAGLS